MDTRLETALDGIGGNPLPRFGTSRRSQHKRSLHARGQGSSRQQSTPAVVSADPHAKRPRLNLVPRRASTAPSYKASGQTEHGDTFDTAGVCRLYQTPSPDVRGRTRGFALVACLHSKVGPGRLGFVMFTDQLLLWLPSVFHVEVSDRLPLLSSFSCYLFNDI